MEEVRVPLLASQDSCLQESSEELLKDDIMVRFSARDTGKQAWGSHEPMVGDEAMVGGEAMVGDEAMVGEDQVSKTRKKKQYSGSEMMVAVFVVAFDTKKGNVVEWKYPSEVVLEGIEFKSMASGLHKITKDFIYFKQNQLYGLSCFEKIPVSNEEERGARMKSVGLLAVGYSDLHLHMDFLQRQVRSQVECPGEYGSLEEYFRHYRNPQLAPGPPSTGQIESAPHIPTTLSAESAHPPGTQVIQHPVGCFSQFLRHFGPHVFTLWRLSLLKKRVLMFSQPPIGEVCHRVYCTCLLSAHSLPVDLDTECSPQFYVNVADIDHLESLDSYVACTTEKIFQSKTYLYDVFVDGADFSTFSENSKHLLRPTLEDQRKYAHLESNGEMSTARKNEEDLVFAEYFQKLNNRLFRLLLQAANSEDHVLTVEMIQSVQLDPNKDRIFLTELANVHNLNLTVQHFTDMFTCCL